MPRKIRKEKKKERAHHGVIRRHLVRSMRKEKGEKEDRPAHGAPIMLSKNLEKRSQNLPPEGKKREPSVSITCLRPDRRKTKICKKKKAQVGRAVSPIR